MDVSSISNLNSLNKGIDLSLNLDTINGAVSSHSYKQVFQQGVSPTPAGSFLGQMNYSRCFSSNHWRAQCYKPVRCGLCFRLGHAAVDCKYPPWFPGLSNDRRFASSFQPDGWNHVRVDLWFSKKTSMNVGPLATGGPLVFDSLQEMG